MKLPVLFKAWIAVAAVCLAVQVHASNVVVTNLADSGPGTLRDALAQAQNGDTVTFDVTGAITNDSGELIVSHDITILGPGPDVLSVAGTNWGPRIFQVPAGVTAVISGLTLRDTYAGLSYTGGAISNAGNLTITNCIFSNCRSLLGGSAADPAPGGVPGGRGYDGGAIYNSGALVLLNCNFFGNVASAGGYGLAGPNGGGGNGGNGGALYTSGTLFATNCNFLTNSAGAGGAGGSGYFAPGGGLGGSPNGSPAGSGGHGGAVYATGPATFVNCTFGFNRSGTGGAAGTGFNGTSTHPTGGHGGNGGNAGNGIAVFSLGQLTLISCTIAQNLAGNGSAGGGGGSGYMNPGGAGGNGGAGGSGALYCTGAAQLTACTFMGNNAGNQSGKGGNGGGGGAGGLHAVGGAGGNGGDGGSGGSIYGNSSNALMTLQNVLLYQDFAGGPGSGAGGGSGGGTGIPSGASGSFGSSGTGPELAGMFTSLGHNFVYSDAGSTGFTNGVLGDIVNQIIPVALGQLGPYGGPILTCPITSPSSKILDVGDDAILATLSTDARGLPRLAGGHVDIGAFEFQWPTFPLVINGSVSNGTFFVTFTNVPGINRSSVYREFEPGSGWGFVGNTTEVSPGVYQWSDTSVSDNPQQCYKVRWP